MALSEAERAIFEQIELHFASETQTTRNRRVPASRARRAAMLVVGLAVGLGLVIAALWAAQPLATILPVLGFGLIVGTASAFLVLPRRGDQRANRRG